MHCCTILSLAYILSMLVSLIPCGVSIEEIIVCNEFPSNLFRSQTIGIGCGYEKTGIHDVHHSPITDNIHRGSCRKIAGHNKLQSYLVECTVFAGEDENVDPHQNPTFIAVDSHSKEIPSYGYYYVLKQDGVYSCYLEHNQMQGCQFYQTWVWPVKYGIYIHNHFKNKGWVDVSCKFDKWNGIHKTIFPGEKGSAEPIYFVVNISPDEENKIPCQVNWKGRNTKYSRRRYSFFALDKRWADSSVLLHQGKPFNTVNLSLREDGVHQWNYERQTDRKVQSWRENESKSFRSSSSANKKKTKQRNLPRWKFSQKKTLYFIKKWDRQDIEYSSAYNQKTLYCPENSRLCTRQS